MCCRSCARGVLGSKETVDAAGRVTGLECWVVPMYRAQRGGERRDVLALSRVELAVLLRLIEVLFAPGWVHRDGRVTPAGLLAERWGRGAATDRLGLLLMVLSSNRRGWLQLCPGSVDTSRGRPAATLGRLLGCSPAGGAKVLARLQERGVLRVGRRETASGLLARSRVRLLPVARAHGVLVREAREATGAVFSDLAVSASGDVGAASGAVAPVVTGVTDAGQGQEAGSADRAVAAHLHASHAPVVTPVVQGELSGGFSGGARGGKPRRPDRGCARGDGPLRGEQDKRSPSSGAKFTRGPVADAPVRVVDGAGPCRQQRGRVPLPPEDLRAVLAPVDLVWARLERSGARQVVVSRARTELTAVVGYAGRADAPQVLADRLARRLSEQLRTGGPITDPVGWLLGRGLPQRQECGDVRCDDRVLLDSGRSCPRCEERQADRRAQRRVVAASVDAAMPGACEVERRAAAEQQLHASVTARAWAKAHEWEQHHARQRQAAAAQPPAEGAAAPPDSLGPAALVTSVRLPAPRPAAAVPALPDGMDEDQELVLEDLTREQVLGWRTRAARDHQVVFDHIRRYGEASAQRLFTRAFVAKVRRLSGLGHLALGYTPWEPT